jgi:hypothetical protein
MQQHCAGLHCGLVHSEMQESEAQACAWSPGPCMNQERSIGWFSSEPVAHGNSKYTEGRLPFPASACGLMRCNGRRICIAWGTVLGPIHEILGPGPFWIQCVPDQSTTTASEHFDWHSVLPLWNAPCLKVSVHSNSVMLHQYALVGGFNKDPKRRFFLCHILGASVKSAQGNLKALVVWN